MAHIAGLVAAGLHPSPVGYADVITSTTHGRYEDPGGFILTNDEKLAKNKSLSFQEFKGTINACYCRKNNCFW